MENNKTFLWYSIVIFTGLYNILLTIGLVILLIFIWPFEKDISNFLNLQGERLYLMIVMITGAIGSLIFTMKSFAQHFGANDFNIRWIWWYYLKPFLGSCLALIFYFLIRGGLLTSANSPDQINLYGIAALSSIAGMFTEQAINKLKNVFDTLFTKTEI
ncbi:MAG: hypothetical protein MJB14_12555 [Spirochaetes bacterium]|nr:hypothetical protein [Spirochaetota bacterium]